MRIPGGKSMDESEKSCSPLVRQIRVLVTHCLRYSATVAPVNAPASWPSMDRTKPQPGFPFPRRKTKHRFVRLRALTAGVALADLCQRLVFAVITRFSDFPNRVNAEIRILYCILGLGSQ